MKNKKHFITAIFLVFVFSLSVLFFALPKSEYSSNEKRVLQETPKFSFSALFDGSLGTNVENYLSDHFPFRNFFVGLNAYFELYTGRNGVGGIYSAKDGYLISAPEKMNETALLNNISRFSDFAKQNSLDAKLILVPSAGYILEDKLPKYHEEYNDDKIFSTVKENSEIELIDLRENFKNDENQIYYKTDHHLTAYGSYLMYEEYCKVLGEEAKAFETKETYNGFYGTTYSRSGLWGKNPDTIELWKNENADVTVTIDDATSSKTSNSIFFTEHLSEDDKYPVYLDGNHSLVTVKNNKCDNGKKLLIVKDSYAHCFTTFLYEHYSEIYMVDMRYYRKSVSSLVSENGITDVLYLYGVDNFSTDTNSAWLM